MNTDCLAWTGDIICILYYIDIITPSAYTVMGYLYCHSNQHAGCTNPKVHLNDPIITTRNPSPAPTLRIPYKYADRRQLSPFNSDTHVLTVVAEPQNPSMTPCNTWQLVKRDLVISPPVATAPMPLACCKS